MNAENSITPLELIPRSSYVHELKPHLPEWVFERATSRLAFFAVYGAIAAFAMVVLAAGWLPWFAWPVLSVAIGFCFAGMAFVAHEAMHGAIVKSKRLQYAIGWLGFLAFNLSPRLWLAWHNEVHHATTNLPNDPDSYPTLEQYQSRKTTRIAVDVFAPGGKRLRGLLTHAIGFNGQIILMLVTSLSAGYVTREQYRRIWLETILALAIWTSLALVIGLVPFIFAYLLPLLVANGCVMAFILTNHSLSPRVDTNDPLVNGLSVTVPRIVDWLTLGFGYHVEHHLFPAMSTRHAREVKALVQKHWPDRYQSMPLLSALWRLHKGGRVYKTTTTLFDPKTGITHRTLGATEIASRSESTPAA